MYIGCDVGKILTFWRPWLDPKGKLWREGGGVRGAGPG